MCVSVCVTFILSFPFNLTRLFLICANPALPMVLHATPWSYSRSASPRLLPIEAMRFISALIRCFFARLA